MKKFLIVFCAFGLLMQGCSTTSFRETTSREIRKAEASLHNAREEEAPVYASEIYLDAQQALTNAREMMNAEQFKEAHSLAEKAGKRGNAALNKSQEERKRIKALAERLLLRGEELLERYKTGAESELAPDVLAEIRVLLDNGYAFLRKDRFMDSLTSAQKAHQKLVFVPEFVDKGKVSRTEERKILTTRLSAEEIIESAEARAAEIIAKARKDIEYMRHRVLAEATTARKEEFERIYPSIYTVKEDETLLDIAAHREIFNDSFMWPLIYKANRDQIRDPKFVFPNQRLTIPRDITREDIIEARKEADAPPPYDPPKDAYNPRFYRRYMMIVPEAKDTEQRR